MLSRVDPLRRGVALALFSVAALSVALYFFLEAVPPPSPELLRTLATIGAVLLLGYMVEMVWLVPRVERDPEYAEWLGFVIGMGFAGLVAVFDALLLAEHLAAGHDNVLDRLGLGWAAVSLAILGGMLVLHPLLADRFADRSEPGESKGPSRPPAS